MRYRFVDAHKKAWPVNLMCSVLSVSRSGYYHWTERGPSRREQSNRKLDSRIREIFARHRQCYGVPRITDELHDAGIECSENHVARRMRALGLKAIQAKKFKVTTDSNHSKPVAADLIEQDFSAPAPNQKRTSDITYGAPSLGRRLDDADQRITNRLIRVCGLKCRLHLHGLTGGMRMRADDKYASDREGTAVNV